MTFRNYIYVLTIIYFAHHTKLCFGYHSLHPRETTSAADVTCTPPPGTPDLVLVAAHSPSAPDRRIPPALPRASPDPARRRCPLTSRRRPSPSFPYAGTLLDKNALPCPYRPIPHTVILRLARSSRRTEGGHRRRILAMRGGVAAASPVMFLLMGPTGPSYPHADWGLWQKILIAHGLRAPSI
jgi:hypothetical protein